MTSPIIASIIHFNLRKCINPAKLIWTISNTIIINRIIKTIALTNIKMTKIIELRSRRKICSFNSNHHINLKNQLKTTTIIGISGTTTRINRIFRMSHSNSQTFIIIGVANLRGEIGTILKIKTKLSLSSIRLTSICTPKTLTAFTESLKTE